MKRDRERFPKRERNEEKERVKEEESTTKSPRE